MIPLFLQCVTSATQRGSPSYWLNNWDKTNPIIAYWNIAQMSWTVEPTAHPGINHVKAYSEKVRDVLTADSFAVEVDGKIYGNDMLFNNTHLGGCTMGIDGKLSVIYDQYSKKALPITIERDLYMPPNEEYYLVKYIIKSADGASHRIRLLDYAVSGTDKQYSTGTCTSTTCSMNRDAAYIASVVISLDKNYDPLTTVGNGDFKDSTNPLTAFAATGTIPSFPQYAQSQIAYGALYDFNLQNTATVSSIRAFGRSFNDAKTTMAKASALGSDNIIKLTNERYTAFLSKGVQPLLTGDALDLYKKSILTLKNSQNPEKGLISSSLHPNYDYKNWMRDSVMAAFMLDAAGYHDEFKLFFDWVDTAELRDDGGFHTTYDVMTGDVSMFVEPQFDANGLYLVALNYHLKVYGDEEWVKGKLNRAREMVKFINTDSGFHKLPLSDRSPWEESSDHHTKEPLPCQWYSWEMGCLFGGMRAAASIENKIGDAKRAQEDIARSEEIRKGVLEALWDKNNNKLYRGVRDDAEQMPDTRADSASMSCVFFGLISGDAAKSHLNFITSKLSKLGGGGIARYEGDPYFFDSVWNPCGEGTRETQVSEPAWPVVTAYVAWSEKVLGMDIKKRLNWMVSVAANGNMPTGEAVDSKDGALVVPSAPDCFEHAGVYVYTTLLDQGKARSLIDTF
ncbi:hypothetical protein TVAG_150220 [Trichomonas vaginalis G3]|uniref:GH15-like domain-containing protein n=1 Tax=Trichomonas vaginalis (strain ATCC PRA-98 / G3) TaxID=412133 RepID=A2DRS4_TRIV3|nr:trehalase family [Trichomonas vaginalis G3]EAY16871.1 hypothetical protein TVAG_150220 [Trichomonas vaginalis G3]KAI5489142.1 trehalase family [Trichomonas vaginalis G3]|eukprot:XP_001329094.1 hypothetical protein [Trichomonas vaginalis G3]